MVKASVIIPTLNEAKRISRCFEFLSHQTFKDFEIIVVDSGSEDETADIARSMGARILYEPRLGVSVAKNFGAAEARGEILIFTDADTVHPSRWIEKIMGHFSDEKVACVFGPVKPADPGPLDNAIYAIATDYLPRFAIAFGFAIAHGSNQAFRRDIFLKAGGYDERLNVLEDNELPNRIKAFGKVVFDPDVWVLASTRRYRREGYIRTTMKYAAAYWNIYVKKIRQPMEYVRIR